ncbi:hypothetical protein L3556_07290 [Candidatus Synechococcus calcipolaris G9]|uniref:Uncharacterized protein n=1 Tax=Candidatus Synechococcus calcipolaris G9 TaxID=1497997 RepID=A0ABT6EY49_9SYNE|nr:hypothetical protein [Candidatus Synechococcus calcipolaris]MDG2990735.1 hypothetical protein [Candidatus Synechococcus calcipolaris G9]
MHPFTELEMYKINLPGLSFEIGTCHLDQSHKVAKCDYGLMPTIDNLAPVWEWAKSQEVYICHCSEWGDKHYHSARRVTIEAALVRFHGYALSPFLSTKNGWVLSFSPYKIDHNDLGCLLISESGDCFLDPSENHLSEFLYIVPPNYMDQFEIDDDGEDLEPAIAP